MTSLQQQQQQQRVKYGPPHHIKRRPYHPILESLEFQTNQHLIQEYSLDIVNTLSQLESLTLVNPAMIDLQPEIQWFMRPFLLDFLIELHSSFKLQPTTLFLCLNIIDRYCAKRIVFKRHYQLVGCTALWIASKYEDKKLRVPTLKELTIMCRNAYDEEMFVQMEMHILSTLDWSIGHPTLEDCLQLAIDLNNLSNNTTNDIENKSVRPNRKSSISSAVTAVARFLCELSLYDKYFLSVPPSLIAITANLLSCSMLQIPHASITLKNLIEQEIINPQQKKQKKALSSNSSRTTTASYTHQNQLDVRHSSFDEDIDLDSGDEEDDDEDYIDEFYETNNYDDTNATTFDESINKSTTINDENQPPQIHTPFLSGLDEDSILSIKKICLMLIIQLSKVTEVLSKKYENLGVIQVINNFHSNYKFIIQSIYENQELLLNTINDSTNNNEIDYKLIQSSEILLQFPKFDEYLTEDEDENVSTDDEANSQPQGYDGSGSDGNNQLFTPKSPNAFSSNSSLTLNNHPQSMVPVTPPSATSQYSLFSNKNNRTHESTSGLNSTCNTPTHISISSFAPPQPPPGSILKPKLTSINSTNSLKIKKLTSNSNSSNINIHHGHHNTKQEKRYSHISIGSNSSSKYDGFSPIKSISTNGSLITNNGSFTNIVNNTNSSSPLMNQQQQYYHQQQHQQQVTQSSLYQHHHQYHQ